MKSLFSRICAVGSGFYFKIENHTLRKTPFVSPLSWKMAQRLLHTRLLIAKKMRLRGRVCILWFCQWDGKCI